MTTYTRRWIRSGPLTQLARRRQRGEIVRLAGWRGSVAGRSKVWRGEGRRTLELLGPDHPYLGRVR